MRAGKPSMELEGLDLDRGSKGVQDLGSRESIG